MNKLLRIYYYEEILSLLVGVLFTLTSFGQDPSEINYGALNTVTKVGDELTVEFKYTKKDEGGLNSTSI